MKRYSDFFKLFKSFKGYCEFFLLHDLTDEGFNMIKFFMSFSDFGDPTIPKDANEYEAYRINSIQFVKKRNQRILNHETATFFTAIFDIFPIPFPFLSPRKFSITDYTYFNS